MTLIGLIYADFSVGLDLIRFDPFDPCHSRSILEVAWIQVGWSLGALCAMMVESN